MIQQTYELQVLALARELQACELEPGTVLRVTVAHDATCAKLRGGRCDCEPFVSVGELWPAGSRGYPRLKKGGGYVSDSDGTR